MPATTLAAELATLGVGVLPTALNTLRAVTNLMVNQADIDTALEQMATAMSRLQSQSTPAQPATSVAVSHY